MWKKTIIYQPPVWDYFFVPALGETGDGLNDVYKAWFCPNNSATFSANVPKVALMMTSRAPKRLFWRFFFFLMAGLFHGRCLATKNSGLNWQNMGKLYIYMKWFMILDTSTKVFAVDISFLVDMTWLKEAYIVQMVATWIWYNMTRIVHI